MAISDELTRIQTAKADIKASIEAKGVTVSDSTLISGYAALVDQIPTGGGGGGGNEDLINLIERDVKTLNIPSGTRQIGSHAFSSCNSLTSVTIPNSVTEIGSSAFFDCSVLTSITIPNSVTYIENRAFSYCSGLTSVTIPNSVTEIGSNAFERCSSLKSITIPNSITSIGNMAFNKCTGLTSVTIQATTPPTLSNKNAFDNTNNCPIYVPAESVNAYKTATNWSSLASRIQSIVA